MKGAAVVNLPRVRAALGELDRLVADNPQLCESTRAAQLGAWLETTGGDNVATNDKQTAIRIPAELNDRLDRIAELWRAERPGLRMTRSDVHRILLMQALERAEVIAGAAAQGGDDGKR